MRTIARDCKNIGCVVARILLHYSSFSFCVFIFLSDFMWKVRLLVTNSSIFLYVWNHKKVNVKFGLGSVFEFLVANILCTFALQLKM